MNVTIHLALAGNVAFQRELTHMGIHSAEYASKVNVDLFSSLPLSMISQRRFSKGARHDTTA